MAWRYQPIATLGRGGMADVYLAIARGPVGFNKLVVLKHLRSSDDDGRSLDMFLDEARLAARLNHPNIVNTYDVGHDGDDDSYFIAMEYLEGQSLGRLLKAVRNTAVDSTAWLRIAAEALRGLHYAHELRDYDGQPLGIVHRDVSPANIFVTYDGEVKLLDFGIAKATLNLAHTDAGVFKGKLGYMATEQARGQEVDRRADIFSMGVVLWEALTGRRLLAGGISIVLEKLGSSELPTLQSVRPETDPRVSAIVERALKINPEHRYSTAAEMRENIEEHLASASAVNKPELGRVVTSLFEEQRTSVQRKIERHLASADGGASEAKMRPATSLLVRGEGSSEPSLLSSAPTGDMFWHAQVPRPSDMPRPPRLSPTPSGGTPSVPAPEMSPLVPTSTRPRARRAWVIAGVIAVSAISIALARQQGAPLVPTVASSAPPKITTPATIAVSLDSVPAGAAITWNGQSYGRTPTSVKVPPGTQTFLLAKEGYAIQPVVIEAVDPERPVARTVNLRPQVDSSPTPQPLIKRPALMPPNRARARFHGNRQEPSSGPPPSALLSSPASLAESPPASPAATPFSPPVSEPAAASVTARAAPPEATPPPGTVDPKAVNATIRAHAAEVRACLDRARMEQPDLKGRLSVRASLSASGRVLSVTPTSSIPGGARLQACVLSALEGWTFPPPSGGVNGSIAYSFVFE